MDDKNADALGQPPDTGDIPDINVEPGLEPITAEEPVDTPVNDIPAEPGEPTEPTGDEPSEPTGKQIDFRQLNAKNQSRYQNVLNALRTRVTPEVYEQIKSEANRTTNTQFAQPTPQPEADNLFDLTPEQFKNLIRDTVRVETTQLSNEMRQQEAWKGEMMTADTQYSEYIKGQNFTEQDIQAAIKEVQNYGFDINQPGGPTKAAMAMIKELELIKYQKGHALSVEQKQIIEQQKADQIKQTIQPAGSAAAPTVSELSPQREQFLRTQKLKAKTFAELAGT